MKEIDLKTGIFIVGAMTALNLFFSVIIMVTLVGGK